MQIVAAGIEPASGIGYEPIRATNSHTTKFRPAHGHLQSDRAGTIATDIQFIINGASCQLRRQRHVAADNPLVASKPIEYSLCVLFGVAIESIPQAWQHVRW